MLHELELFELMDWKRRVFDLYASVRSTNDPEAAWKHWREVRDELFRTHPQSPIPSHERAEFGALDYFDYDPQWRVLANVTAVEPVHYDIATSTGSSYGFSRFASASFEVCDRDMDLELYWLDGYGGGLFVPFRDATSGKQTYGGGRYLLDTVKGADLGVANERLVLDFNFSYNPSCCYDPRWACPLAPPPNRLEIEVVAGERFEKGGAR